MALTRRLVSHRFPYLPLRVIVQGVSFEIEALLDTGFDGSLIVPNGFFGAAIAADFETVWLLADDSRIEAPAYLGVIQLGDLGNYESLISEVGSEALVGRRLTEQRNVVLDHGRRLIVEP